MFTKEVREELNTEWLLHNVTTKQHTARVSAAQREKFLMYLCKCYLFHSKVDITQWLRILGNCCIRFDDIRIGLKYQRLPMKFFMQDGLMCGKIFTLEEAEERLDIAITHTPEYDRDFCSEKEAENFLVFWDKLREEISDYMSDEEIFDTNTYVDIIQYAISHRN